MEHLKEKVDLAIDGRFTRDDNLLDLMAKYHMSAGGKRFRALLALTHAQDLAIPFSDAMKWALACELLHNATLVHDDIQDEDPLRRGQPSVWAKFGRDQAINLGDYLIFSAFELLAEIEIKRAASSLVACLSTKAKAVTSGQALEIHLTKMQSTNFWQSYLQIAELKTGALLQAPLEGIYILAGKSTEEAASLSKEWSKLGLVYQINDDINDFLGRKQDNQSYKDFAEKKINSLISWLSLDQQHADLINRYIRCEKDSDEHQQATRELITKITKHGVLDELLHVKRTFFQQFQASGQGQASQVLAEFLLDLDKQVPGEELKNVPIYN